MSDIITLPNGLDAVEVGGVYRVLAKLPPDPRKRAAIPRLAAPVIEPKDWVEIDRRSDFGDDYILDQKSHGSCTGFGSAGALMRARTLEGMPFVRLSGAYTYAWINGGRDDGAIISDTLVSLQQHGTCPEAECPWDRIYRSQIPASADGSAQRFRILEAYRVDHFDELVSGLQLGFVGVGAVQVGNRFTDLDADGVAGLDRGPGNHAVCFDGVRRLASGEWVIDLPNSWGLAFGIRGRCYVTQRHIDGVEQDCYLIRAATGDPQDMPPLAK
jgi:hypothetical protein